MTVGSSAIAFAYPDDVNAVLDGLESFVRGGGDRPLPTPTPTSSTTCAAAMGPTAPTARGRRAHPCHPHGVGRRPATSTSPCRCRWAAAAWATSRTTPPGSTCTTCAAAPTGWPSSPSATGRSARAPSSNGSPSGRRDEILPGLMSGETMMCFGMSEPDAGSDATMLRTRAEPDGDGWRLYGRKIWTTHVPIADWMIALAITDPERAKARRGGISAFLVPDHRPRLPGRTDDRHVGRTRRTRGRVRARRRTGRAVAAGRRAARGFQIGLQGVSLGRVYNAARSVGLSRWAIEQAVEYTKTRHAFGHAISEYQGVSFPLAVAATEVHAAHLHGPQRGDAARPGPPGGQGAVDGQGLCRPGRRAGGGPGDADLRRARLHQRAGLDRGVPHAPGDQRRRRDQRDPQPHDLPATRSAATSPSESPSKLPIRLAARGTSWPTSSPTASGPSRPRRRARSTASARRA